VSYEQKHNEDNGQGNGDGATPDIASNYGREGQTDDPVIEGVRNRQAKNMLATLLLSLGTPMLLGGDEMRRTQRGNNNPWCQDNEISWYDWRLVSRHADLHRFCREVIAFRRGHPAFRRPTFYGGSSDPRDAGSPAGISWMTETGQPADWSPARRTLMLLIDGKSAALAGDGYDSDIALLFNASGDPVEFTLPARQQCGGAWHRVIDTARRSPGDILPAGSEEPVGGGSVRVEARSLAAFLAR
jgi:isoamylase